MDQLAQNPESESGAAEAAREEVVWRGRFGEVGAIFAKAKSTHALSVQCGDYLGIGPSDALLIWQRDQMAQRYPVVIYQDVPEGAMPGDSVVLSDDGRLRVSRGASARPHTA